jgi:hypothetical protein
MAKSKNRKGSSIIKSSASQLLSGKKGQIGELRIREFSLDISSLSSMENYANACKSVAAMLVVIVLLVQLRCLRPDTSSTKMDQTPAFRFYKRRVIVHDIGRVAACVLASCVDEAVMHLPTEPVELNELLIAIIDCYQGNEKALEKCNSDNVDAYIAGQMSRLMGYAASCPSSNMTAFGLTADCLNWSSVDEVLKLIPCEDIKKVSPEEVKSLIKETCGLVAGSDGNVPPIIFDEKPYTGSFAVEGGCRLEKDVFGEYMPTRTHGSQETVLKTQGKVSEEEIANVKPLLSSLELRKVESAMRLRRFDIIRSFITEVEKRNAQSTDVVNDQESSVNSAEVAPPPKKRRSSSKETS